MGVDSVVMVEHTEELDQNTVEILKAVAPFDNVVRKGEDFKARETLLTARHRLRPQDLGLLAAMGAKTVAVYSKPSVAIISSGDEVVPIEDEPPAGCVRDINRYTLSAMIQEAHANPVWIGNAPDKLNALSALITKPLVSADVVVKSARQFHGEQRSCDGSYTGPRWMRRSFSTAFPAPGSR